MNWSQFHEDYMKPQNVKVMKNCSDECKHLGSCLHPEGCYTNYIPPACLKCNDTGKDCNFCNTSLQTGKPSVTEESQKQMWDEAFRMTFMSQDHTFEDVAKYFTITRKPKKV